MIKFIDMTGKTEDEAIRRALEQLGLERDDVSVEILERAKSGFLGIGGSPATVRPNSRFSSGATLLNSSIRAVSSPFFPSIRIRKSSISAAALGLNASTRSSSSLILSFIT